MSACGLLCSGALPLVLADGHDQIVDVLLHNPAGAVRVPGLDGFKNAPVIAGIAYGRGVDYMFDLGRIVTVRAQHGHYSFQNRVA